LLLAAGIAAIVGSRGVVHTVFTLRYALCTTEIPKAA
jgi:hypothetical protein